MNFFYYIYSERYNHKNTLEQHHSIQIEGTLRLNSKNPDKPKPLVVVLKDKNDKNRILFAAKKLKSSVPHRN